jgi:uncharacterized protein YjaG (DUF416 family)
MEGAMMLALSMLGHAALDGLHTIRGRWRDTLRAACGELHKAEGQIADLCYMLETERRDRRMQEDELRRERNALAEDLDILLNQFRALEAQLGVEPDNELASRIAADMRVE